MCDSSPGIYAVELGIRVEVALYELAAVRLSTDSRGGFLFGCRCDAAPILADGGSSLSILNTHPGTCRSFQALGDPPRSASPPRPPPCFQRTPFLPALCPRLPPSTSASMVVAGRITEGRCCSPRREEGGGARPDGVRRRSYPDAAALS